MEIRIKIMEYIVYMSEYYLVYFGTLTLLFLCCGTFRIINTLGPQTPNITPIEGPILL